MKHHPPKRALKFLRWFCREDYIEEIEGDLAELFRKESGQSTTTAKRRFAWRVLRTFRPEFIKSFSSNYNPYPITMFRHNLLITLRSYLRYKSSFLINLIGLSSGLACALMIFLWVHDELNMDGFHSKRLYQVLENVKQDDRVITRNSTPGPMAEALQQEFPEVEYAITSTFNWSQREILSVEDRDVKMPGLYADSAFFEIFAFPLLLGDSDHPLSDKNSIVLSESLASSLFGSPEAALGSMLGLAHKKQLKVSAVMTDMPAKSSARFDFVLPFELFREENDWVNSWGNTAPQTYVLLREGTDVEAFNAKIADLVREKTEGQSNHRTPFVVPFADRYLHGRYENGVLAGGRIDYVEMFSLIAIFILFIACINFMNLATARASRRSKEVGIKKAIGARRGALVIQYFSESGIMTLVSLIIALIMVALLLPQFNLITDKHLTLQFDRTLILLVCVIALVTGFVSGSYPALYLSRFNPVTVLKGRMGSLMGEAWARKGLVVFQFALSIILIISVLVVYQQIHLTQTRYLGYDKENILIIDREGALNDKLETFVTEVAKIPGVAGATASGHSMTGHNGGTYGVEWPGKDPDDRTEFERFSCTYGLIELLDMKMEEGRPFSRSYGAEEDKIIFNEAGIDFMGMQDPIGKKVKLWGMEKEIIGVVRDFNFESFHERVKPAIFFLGWTGNIMIKLEAGKEQETLARIEAFYHDFNPGFPISYRFLNEDYQKLYTAESRVATLSKYFAGLAIIISCLGLFGLAAFTAERRMKEIGIRKILGSSSLGIVYLLTGEFTRMVVAAIVVALPAGYFMASYWLDTFVFRISLQWWFFAGAGLVALLISWFTVGIQTLRAARVNPAQVVRTE